MSQSIRLFMNDNDRVGGLDGWIVVPFFSLLLQRSSPVFLSVSRGWQHTSSRSNNDDSCFACLRVGFERKRRMDCLCLTREGGKRGNRRRRVKVLVASSCTRE